MSTLKKKMNKLDKQYQQLLQDIIDYGVEKKDRTGTGTKSIFGYTIRHKMSDGFPLLTTKKVAFKTMVTELLWFLKGDTNIKYLVDNDCHIWDGDAYKNYLNNHTEDSSYRVAYFDEEVKFRPYTSEEFINNIKSNDAFAKQWGELGSIYGKQWRNWTIKTLIDPNTFEYPYVDQIQNLINNLKTNPDSRRLLVSAWNVAELDQMVLPPCHYGFQVYTRELSFEERASRSYLYSKLPTQTDMPTLSSFVADILPTDENGWSNLFDEFNIPTRAISLMWNQRSVDTFLGLPFNIASYGLLLEIIAKVVNMVPDELIGNLGDTHLYLNHIEQAKLQTSRDTFELPKLNINTEFWQTESGECGVGPLNTNLQGFEIDDFQLENYQSHPSIKAPLSN
jgi:thymidylate synthase